MRINDFVKLERRLLPRLSVEFAIRGSLFFIAPFGITLRGFQFEPSGFSPKNFNVTMFFLPLCVPIKETHLTFGRRLSDEKGWNCDQEDLELRLSNEMRKQIPFLVELETYNKVANALQPFAERYNPHSHEAYAYVLVQGGHFDRAGRLLSGLRASLEPTVEWQREIASRVSLVQSQLANSPQEAQRQLTLWEAESVSNLGLQAFRRY